MYVTNMDNNNPFSGINVKLVKALGKKRVLRTIRRRLNIEWRDIMRRKLEVQAKTARARKRQLVRVLKLKQQCNAINTSRRIVQDSWWSTTYEEPTSQAIAIRNDVKNLLSHLERNRAPQQAFYSKGTFRLV